MNLLSRSLLRSACLAILVFASVANAEDSKDRLRAIAKEAEEVLKTMSQQLRELQYRSMSNDAVAASGGRVYSSGQYTTMDLQRSAQRLSELGSEANSRASRCDKDVRKVARDFQSQARRLNSATSRLMNSRESSSSTLTLDQIEFAMQRAYNLLPSLGSITECTADTEDESADEGEAEAGQDAEKKKKEDEKGTEDYNE